MKNNWLNHFHSIIKIKIEGRNVNHFLKRLINQNIQIIKQIPISYKEVHLIISYDDYLKIKDTKTIYQITIINKYGKLKAQSLFTKNIYLLFFMLLGLGLLYFLSNIIFSIDIIHSSHQVKQLISSELKEYGLTKYSFKKSYQELEKIEEQILNNNKDKLEWIEIETSGTKYIIRAEERLLNNGEEPTGYQEIIATKNAVITKIEATSGEKIKNINDYVQKGDTIIASYITLPDNSKVYTKAKGKVYGEVWYEINVEYPLVYREEKATGKTKTVYSLNFLHNKFSIFNFHKFKTFNTNSQVLLQSNYLPLTLTKEKQYEVNVIDEVYTKEEAIKKAINLGKNKLKKRHSRIQKINKITILEESDTEDKVTVKLFVSAIEEIGKENPVTPDNQPTETTCN